MRFHNTRGNLNHPSLVHFIVKSCQGLALTGWVLVCNSGLSSWLTRQLVSVQPDSGLLTLSVQLDLPNSGKILDKLWDFARMRQTFHKYLNFRANSWNIW